MACLRIILELWQACRRSIQFANKGPYKQEVAAEEVRQAQAAQHRVAELQRAREAQLDAFRARILAERCAGLQCAKWPGLEPVCN